MNRNQKIIYKKSYYNFYPVTMDNVYEYLEAKYVLYYPEYFKEKIKLMLVKCKTKTRLFVFINVLCVCDYYEDCVKRIKAYENIYDVFTDFDKYILDKRSCMGKEYEEIEREYHQGNYLFIWFTNYLLRAYRFKISNNMLEYFLLILIAILGLLSKITC